MQKVISVDLRTMFTFCLLPFCFTELGTEWAPAVADSSAEFENIGRGELLLDDEEDFWIGSSTNLTPIGVFNYSDYLPDDSGK